MRVTTRIASALDQLVRILSVIGVVVTAAALFFVLFRRVSLPEQLLVGGIGGKVGFSLGATVLAFLTGAFSSYLATGARKLSRTKRVFLSYSSRGNADVAQAVAEHLRNAGVKVWDSHELRPGIEWASQIQDAMDQANALVIVVPTEPNKYVSRELELAQSKGLKILPVIANPTDPSTIDPSISKLAWIDLQSDRQRGLDRLVDAVASA